MNWKWLWDWLGVLKIWENWHRSLTRVGGGRGQFARRVRGGEGAGEAGARAQLRPRHWGPAALRGQGERRGGVVGGGGGETQFRGRGLGGRRVAVSNWHPDCGTRGEGWGEIVKIVVSGGHQVLPWRGQLRKVVKSGLEKIVWTWVKHSVEVGLGKWIIKRTFPIHRTVRVEIISNVSSL